MILNWRKSSQRRALGAFACARGLLRRVVCHLLLVSAAFHLGSIGLRPQDHKATPPGLDAAAPAPNSIESRKQTLSKLTADRDRLRKTNDPIALVRTINQIGELHLKLNDLAASLVDAREALSAARQSQDDTLLLDTLNFAARVYRYRQSNQTAVSLLTEARALSLRSKNRQGEAQSLTELGAVYFQQSELPKARDCNDKALEIWRELQDRRGEARALTNQGEVYMRQENAGQAANALEAAAGIWRNLGDSIELANTLLDLNFLSIRQGQWQKALSTLNEAQLLVTDKEAEPYLAGQIATSFGEAYEAYGQLDTALEYFREAQAHYRDHAHDDLAAIDAGRQVGRVQARIGDYAGAAQQIEQGRKRAEEIGAGFIVGLCHEELGRVWLAAGSYDQARREFLSAIALYERTGNRRPWARAQTFLGQTEYLQGNLGSAAVSYGKALKVFKGVQDYTNEAALCFGLGKLALRQQKLEAAGVYLQRSIALTEELRENASSKELRSSFLASVHDRYESYVEWLMQRDAKEPGKHFDIAAFEASERGRARSLLDSLKDSQRELRKVANPALLLDEEKLQKEEQQLLDEQAELQSEGGNREVKEKLDDQMKQIRTRRETLEAQINTTVKFGNLIRALPLEFDEIRRQVTDSDTSLLEYSLGDQTSYLWMITPSGMTGYKLPDKITIEKSVRKLSDLLTKPHIEPAEETELQSAIAEVSGIVLGPVAEKLSSNRLIIIPDGILQYIPFQILASPSAPNEPLVARHEIVNAPSASTLALVQREAINRHVAPRLLAALGDPVLPSNYSTKVAELQNGNYVQAQRGADDREGETLEPAKLGPLFFARHELNELRKLAPAGDTIVYSDFAATRDNLRNLDLRQYRILHFATHGLLDAKQPELSGLVLSLMDRNGQRVNGFVGLSDIYNLRAPVDLVVLSACRTALGKEVRGEGLVGLTRGFMYAGASTVVASLWKVDDEATAELMKRFYTNILQHGMTPAAALRAAQNSIRREPQWHSPYYWAAFTLQGDYRQVIAVTPASPVRTYLIIVGGSLLLLLVVVGTWWYRRQRRTRTAYTTTGYSRMR